MIVPEATPISIRSAGDEFEAVVAVSGELDAASRNAVERALHLAEDSRPARLVIDLRGLEFMDTTGISCVLRARQRAQRTGRDVRVLVRRDAQPAAVFVLCGLETIVEIV